MNKIFIRETFIYILYKNRTNLHFFSFFMLQLNNFIFEK